MSHNKIKIGTAEPNRISNISPNLGDINDVSISSAGDGEFLKYNSGTWENAPAAASTYYIWCGEGAENAYSNSGATGSPSAGDAWFLYDSSPKNTISGATITKIGATDWIDYITLPAGNYVVDAQFFAEWTASGYLELALYQSTSSTPTWTTATTSRASATAYIGETLGSYAISNVITGQFEITASHVTAGENRVRLQIVGGSNLASYDSTPNQNTTPSKYNYLFIAKV